MAVVVLAALAVVAWRSSRPGVIAPPAGSDAGEAAVARAPVEEQRAPAIQRTTVDTPAADAAVETATGDRPATAADPTRLSGRVVTQADGTPVIGAEVQLRYRDADDFWNLDLEYGKRQDVVATRESDREGRFAFDVARGKPYRLHVFAAGYAPATVLDCVGGSEVVVRIGRGATIEGVVTRAADDTPVGGVPVRVFVRGASVELGSADTAPDGSFRFANVPSESVFVEVLPADLEPPDWKRLQLEEGQLYRVEFALEAGRTVSGVVTAASTRAPIAGAELSDGWVFRRVVRTDANGRYQMHGLGSRLDLYVRADGYAPQSLAVPATTDHQDFALVHGGRVTGRFVDERRAPRGDVHAAVAASFMMRQGMEDTDWRRANVAPDGTFVATGLDPHQRYQLYVRGEGIGARTYVLPRLIPEGDTLDVGEIVVRPGGGLEGRVVDDGGAPVGGADVTIRGHNDDMRALLGENASNGDRPGSRPVTQFESRRGRTAADGTFRFAGLSAGTYALLVRGHGRSRSVEFGPYRVQDGEITSDVEAVIENGASIAGRVRFAGGREAAGLDDLQLAALKAGSRDQWARVGGDGRFRFEGIEAGQYTLAAVRCPDGWALAPVPGVPAGATDVEIVLQPAAKIAGRVVDANGEPADANIAVWSPGVSFSAVHQTDAGGRFEVSVHPGFVGKITAQPGTGAPFPQATAEHVAAGTTDLVLTLR